MAAKKATSSEPRVLSVSELTWRIKEVLEPRFLRVLVRGEISGFRGANTSGHFYFAIKDQNATIEVRLWRKTAQRLKFGLKEGLSVIIDGELSVYAPQGRYALIVNSLEPEGVGARTLAFQQLKEKLAAEGLIGEKRARPPRPLPFLPRRIGVVTSLSGAALRDFLKVLHRRHPRLPVLICDARVQGDGAAHEVCRGLRWLSRTDVDVIVVTRGGGSVDDLWTFNEEVVARAIVACRVPVVSAVGHEIDTTLADLVADARAPTPSAAAELLAPVLRELEVELVTTRARLARAAEKHVADRRGLLRGAKATLGDPRRHLTGQRLLLSEQGDRMTRVARRRVRDAELAVRELTARLQRAQPQAQLGARRRELEQLGAKLLGVMTRRARADRDGLVQLRRSIERTSPGPRLQAARHALLSQAARLASLTTQKTVRDRASLHALSATLDALSPLAVLTRGYSITRGADGRVIRRAADVAPGDPIRVRLAGNDELDATVTRVKNDGQ